jgi:hypothetical protein
MDKIDKWHERYLHDPAFHAVVDCLKQVIVELQLSPAEVREAAMYACFAVETEKGFGREPFRG